MLCFLILPKQGTNALGPIQFIRIEKRVIARSGGKESNEATRTGLEPATSGSTVRGSNQLSYRAKNRFRCRDGELYRYIFPVQDRHSQPTPFVSSNRFSVVRVVQLNRSSAESARKNAPLLRIVDRFLT